MRSDGGHGWLGHVDAEQELDALLPAAWKNVV